MVEFCYCAMFCCALLCVHSSFAISLMGKRELVALLCLLLALLCDVIHSSLWRISNYCNVPSKRNNIIKLTHYDETEKRAYDSQIVRAKENLKLSHDWPS